VKNPFKAGNIEQAARVGLPAGKWPEYETANLPFLGSGNNRLKAEEESHNCLQDNDFRQHK